MRMFVCALLLAVGLSSAAMGATRTFEATFTDLTDSGGALAALGADTSATEMVFRWSFDDAAGAFNEVYESSSDGTIDVGSLSYLSFSAEVGGVMLNATPSGGIAPSSRISIADGVTDGFADFPDAFQVASRAWVPGPNGTTITLLSVRSQASNENTFGRSASDPNGSGLKHPTASQLNSLDDVKFGEINLFKGDGSIASIRSTHGTYREITDLHVIPVPATLPLLLAGLGGLGLIARRRAQATCNT